MRQRVRQVCPIQKALGFFSRRQRAMPFAVRFVRRRRTQQKNTKACGRAVRKLAPQNSAPFMLCIATVRPRQRGNRNNFVACLAKRRFARSGLGSEACKPARLRRPAQVCRSDRAQNGVVFGNNTTPACRQDGMTRAACLGKMATTLAARFLRGCYLAGTSFSSLCRTLRLFCSDGICSLFCIACKNTPAYGAGAEARFVYVLVCGLR